MNILIPAELEPDFPKGTGMCESQALMEMNTLIVPVGNQGDQHIESCPFSLCNQHLEQLSPNAFLPVILVYIQ